MFRIFVRKVCSNVLTNTCSSTIILNRTAVRKRSFLSRGGVRMKTRTNSMSYSPIYDIRSSESYRRHVRRQAKRNRTIFLHKMMLRMAGVIAACLLCLIGVSNYAQVHADRAKEPVNFRYYTSIPVEKGDSLWSIARDYREEGFSSVEEYVEFLKEVNQLKSDLIYEGGYLIVSYSDQTYLP